MEQTLLTTKRCSHCGRELPITEFYTSKTCKDGHVGQCKKCVYEIAKARKRMQKQSNTATSLHYTLNPQFADKSPREIIADVRVLINELRARGYQYEGKLTYIQEINL